MFEDSERPVSHAPDRTIGRADLSFAVDFDIALSSRLIQEAGAVLPPELIRAQPRFSAWIDQLLAHHHGATHPLESFASPRVRSFLSPALLRDTSVAVVPQTPAVPWSELGLTQFSLPDEAAGITFRQVYFVRADQEDRDGLHFHETVHVAQYRVLGEIGFLLAYAAGLLRHGYRQSPLEVMAYELQEQFERGCDPFDLTSAVKDRLRSLSLR